MAPVLASPARAAPLLAGRVLPPMSSMPTAAVAVPLPMPDGVPALPLPDSPPEGPSGIAERRIWSAEEDVQIAALVAEHGTRSWSIIAAKLPTRTGKQCRERWHNRTPLHAREPSKTQAARALLHHPTLTLLLSLSLPRTDLDPVINKGEWTIDEDKKLLEAHVTMGNKWAEIAKVLPGRTDNQIKNRWNSALRRELRKLNRLANKQKGAVASAMAAATAAAAAVGGASDSGGSTDVIDGPCRAVTGAVLRELTNPRTHAGGAAPPVPPPLPPLPMPMDTMGAASSPMMVLPPPPTAVEGNLTLSGEGMEGGPAAGASSSRKPCKKKASLQMTATALQVAVDGQETLLDPSQPLPHGVTEEDQGNAKILLEHMHELNTAWAAAEADRTMSKEQIEATKMVKLHAHMDWLQSFCTTLVEKSLLQRNEPKPEGKGRRPQGKRKTKEEREAEKEEKAQAAKKGGGRGKDAKKESGAGSKRTRGGSRGAAPPPKRTSSGRTSKRVRRHAEPDSEYEEEDDEEEYDRWGEEADEEDEDEEEEDGGVPVPEPELSVADLLELAGASRGLTGLSNAATPRDGPNGNNSNGGAAGSSSHTTQPLLTLPPHLTSQPASALASPLAIYESDFAPSSGCLSSPHHFLSPRTVEQLHSEGGLSSGELRLSSHSSRKGSAKGSAKAGVAGGSDPSSAREEGEEAAAACLSARMSTTTTAGGAAAASSSTGAAQQPRSARTATAALAESVYDAIGGLATLAAAAPPAASRSDGLTAKRTRMATELEPGYEGAGVSERRKPAGLGNLALPSACAGNEASVAGPSPRVMPVGSAGSSGNASSTSGSDGVLSSLAKGVSTSNATTSSNGSTSCGAHTATSVFDQMSQSAPPYSARTVELAALVSPALGALGIHKSQMACGAYSPHPTPTVTAAAATTATAATQATVVVPAQTVVVGTNALQPAPPERGPNALVQASNLVAPILVATSVVQSCSPKKRARAADGTPVVLSPTTGEKSPAVVAC